MTNQSLPSEDEIRQQIWGRRNWGRWGDDDQKGAINLITPEKRVEAVQLARTGRAVSLSRPWPTTPGPTNPTPAQHFMQWSNRGSSGVAMDYYGIVFHGYAATHIDALCHIWDDGGMWNGRDPREAITSEGTRFGDITHWKEGIITRGVLLDVPRSRGTPFVTQDVPVLGVELADIAKAQGVEVRAGDALCVYSGREAFHTANPTVGHGSPGLHASCATFLRDQDVSMLVWDMMDARPTGYDLPWSVHGVLFNYGVALLDNALLEPLADACVQEGRYEFLLMVLPLNVDGGTGSPVNPVAMF